MNRVLVLGRPMQWDEDETQFRIYDKKGKEILKVKKNISPNYVAGVATFREKGIRLDALRLAQHLLEENRTKRWNKE